MSENIDALLNENRKFPPSQEFRRDALVSDPAIYARAAQHPDEFWRAQANELEWYEKWRTVLDWKPPHAQWFVGGKLNVSVNCVDRHIHTARRNKAALIWEGEPGDRRTLTYWDLYVEVQKFANVLRNLGVKRGDRVAIYMPLIPEVAPRKSPQLRVQQRHQPIERTFIPCCKILEQERNGTSLRAVRHCQ